VSHQRQLNENNEMQRHLPRDLPPEADLNGRPDGADLLLQRTLGRVRQEKARDARRRGRVVVLLSAVLLSAALGGGIAIGHRLITVDNQTTVGGADNQTTVDAAANRTGEPPQQQVLHGGVANGARMTTTITPSDGWSRLGTIVDGVRQDEKCRLVVTDKNGRKFVAGGWVESKHGDNVGTALAGAVMVPVEDMRTISVVTMDGRVLVTSTL
jgi:hypothetical protein